MRVLHLLEAMGGGTKKHVQLLIAGLMDQGVEVALALPYERPFDARSPLMDYSFPDYMRSQGIRVDQFNLTHGRITPFADLRALVQLVRHLRRNRFDVLRIRSSPLLTIVGPR